MDVKVEELKELTEQGVIRWKKTPFMRIYHTVDFDLNLKLSWYSDMWPKLYLNGQRVMGSDPYWFGRDLEKLWDIIRSTNTNNKSHSNEIINEKIRNIQKALDELDYNDKRI